jgi:hypothetical protein
MKRLFGRGSADGIEKIPAVPNLVFGIALKQLLENERKEGIIPQKENRPYIVQRLIEYLNNPHGIEDDQF